MRICGRLIEMLRFIPGTVWVGAGISQNKWDRSAHTRVWRFIPVELWFPQPRLLRAGQSSSKAYREQPRRFANTQDSSRGSSSSLAGIG